MNCERWAVILKFKTLTCIHYKLDELCFNVPFTFCFCHVCIKSYTSSKLHNDFMDTVYNRKCHIVIYNEEEFS